MKVDIENRTTYQSLLNLADEYLRAYKILEEFNLNITHLFHVKFYLLAHSIELSMKAYLRFKNYSLVELKHLSHDLARIYSELTSKFVYRLDIRSTAYINNINQYYSNKEFEYPTTGSKDIVEIKNLYVVSKMINEVTRIQIQSESNKR